MTGSGTSRTPSPTTAHRTHPQGAMPTHRPVGQMRILRRDTWVPPYRVRRSCRAGCRDAVPYDGSPHPSAGGDAHTSPRRTNAHSAAGHMGPALQGTPVMQDGTSGRRPLQRLTVPIRRRRCPHIAPPDKCAFCGGTHGSRPTGYAGHAGRDVGTPSPTTAHRTHPQGAMPTHRPADICDRTGSLTG